ncbi:vWA domain-containing protein [Alloscardovia criceti]|uniref:vWA domain-containing protein n=1 Tax=Alloscardovia criceti TaxID=356828 RepID=UPI0003825A03|nr:VWA domain-containing protein [Alloscardovia criceti]
MSYFNVLIPTHFQWPLAALILFIVVAAAFFGFYIYLQIKKKHEESALRTPEEKNAEDASAESAPSAPSSASTPSSASSLSSKKTSVATVFHIESDYQTDTAARFLKTYKRLSTVAVAALAVALTAGIALVGRPSRIDPQNSSSSSRDIILCLDVSGSALAYDRQIIAAYSELTQNLHGERIGLSIFNSTSKTIFPLTDDYSVINNQLNYAYTLLSRVQTQESIDAMSDEEYQEINDWLEGTQNVENSTSLIGDGLMSCAMMLPQLESSAARQARSASVILATDNVPSGKQTFTLDEALDAAQNADINVDGLYVGSDETSNSETAVAMKNSIESHGGVYVDLNSNDTVEDITRDIQSTRSSTEQHEDSSNMIDAPALIVALAILVFVIFIAAAGRIRR